MFSLSEVVVQRDDGAWSIGWHDGAPGPFETREFAEAVAQQVVRRERKPSPAWRAGR
jgi:hypothetical protein